MVTMASVTDLSEYKRDQISPFARLVLGTINSANAILRETSADVESHALKLSDLFARLGDSSVQQTEQLAGLVSRMNTIEHQGRQLDLVEVPRLLQNTLEETSERLLVLSKQGVGLIFSLDEIMEEVEDLNACIREIDGINRQTRLLSLNAQIEAARLGENAGGFHVVSTEILGVSKRIDSLSKRMLKRTKSVTTRISEVIGSIRSEYEELSRIGALDLTSQLDAHAGLEILIDALINRNSEIQNTLSETREVSDSISDDIREVVMKMQFQDRMKQRSDAIVEALLKLSDFLDGHDATVTSAAQCDDIARRIVDGITLSEVRRKFAFDLLGEVDDDAVEEESTEIELF